MAIPDSRLQAIIESKDADAALASCKEHGYGEGWALIDGAMVVYDLDSPPAWLVPVLAACDEDGYTPSFAESTAT